MVVEKRERIRGILLNLLGELMRERKPNSHTTLDEIMHKLQERLRGDFCFTDENIMNEEIHLLLLNNVLMRASSPNMVGNWNYLKLTEFGIRCIGEGFIIPLDPNGFLENIKKTLPELDPIIFDYLSESIASFNRNLILASTITLGVASERAILLLADKFCDYIKESNLKGYIDKLSELKFISQKYETLKEALDKLPKKIKNNLPENYEITIDTLFNFIKLNRNEAGHPKGGKRDRALQGANLQAFKSYLASIYALMKFFEQSTFET